MALEAVSLELPDFKIQSRRLSPRTSIVQNKYHAPDLISISKCSCACNDKNTWTRLLIKKMHLLNKKDKPKEVKLWKVFKKIAFVNWITARTDERLPIYITKSHATCYIHFIWLLTKTNKITKQHTHTHVLDAIMFGDKKPGINK